MRYLILLLALIGLAACENRNKISDNTSVSTSSDTGSIVDSATTANETKAQAVKYKLVRTSDSVLSEILAMDNESLKTILALNRIDKKFLKDIEQVLIPDSFFSDFLIYSPFPSKISKLDSVDKLLIASYPIQAFAAYSNGRLINWGPASLGKPSTPTPTGLFHTNWKAKSTISTVNEDWKLDWYFNLTNFGGVSLHQYELPGYPASHACVRLKEYDAKWIYYWADQWRLTPNEEVILAHGTPVITYGNIPEGKPWLELNHDSTMKRITEDELVKIIEPHFNTIIQRQSHRKEFIAKSDTLKT